jgi:integrase
MPRSSYGFGTIFQRGAIWYVIDAFAGLRHAEICRLDWSEVKLDRNFIEVTALKSKTASRRLVTIQPNLNAWLAPFARPKGKVEPPNSRKLREAAQRRAGIGKWPTNALRHSFASYHLAKFQDAPALALQMGHTTTSNAVRPLPGSGDARARGGILGHSSQARLATTPD